MFLRAFCELSVVYTNTQHQIQRTTLSSLAHPQSKESFSSSPLLVPTQLFYTSSCNFTFEALKGYECASRAHEKVDQKVAAAAAAAAAEAAAVAAAEVCMLYE